MPFYLLLHNSQSPVASVAEGGGLQLLLLFLEMMEQRGKVTCPESHSLIMIWSPDSLLFLYYQLLLFKKANAEVAISF